MNNPVFDRPHCGCYFPTWARWREGKGKFVAQNINPNLCSFIIVAFGKVENNQLCVSESSDLEIFETLNNFRKINPRLKVLLAVGGWSLSNQVAEVAATSSSRKNFSNSVLVNLRKWKLDGLDIDWEFPKLENKEQLSSLLKELRLAFESEHHQERLALTIAVQYLSHGGYDGKVINQTCDIVNIMAYDIHGAWDEKKLGHHAPLFNGPFGEDSTNNVADLVASWVEAGIDKDKICVGIPFYGRGWNICSHENALPGGEGNGPVVKSKYCGEKGNWPYFEIAERIKLDKVPVFYDKVTYNAYCVGKDYWISFDNVDSVKAKASWVRSQKLGGVFVWEISQDDFLGESGQGKFPLMNSIQQIMSSKSPASPLVIPTTTSGSKDVHVVKAGDTAYAIACTYKLTLDELKNLNKDKKNLELIQPGDKLKIKKSNILDKGQNSGTQTTAAGSSRQYQVKSGDTAYDIATKFGMTLDQLRKCNPGKGTMELIHPGDIILIGNNANQGTPSDGDKRGNASTSEYIVKAGDTAYEIALKLGMTLDELRKLNPGRGTMEMIHPGDKLVIISKASTTEGSKNLGIATGYAKQYQVKSGDTAYEIAMKFGMTLEQLRKLNPSKGTMELIHAGDLIAIGEVSNRGDGNKVVEGNGAEHVVKSGDTAYEIALKYGMTLDELRKLNPGRGTMEMIYPGDKIKICSSDAS